MNAPRPIRVARFVLLLWAFCLPGFLAGAAEEAAVLELWGQHMAQPDDHQAVIKACRDFVAGHPGDPLLPVVREIEAWHLMRSGQRAEGLKIMSANLAPIANPVNDGARKLAEGWLTCADRDEVVTALQAYYRKNIAYPRSLDQLPAPGRPPLTDRFGKPWDYKLTGLTKIKGFDDQKYALESSFLGDHSDYRAALELPYASRIQAEPLQVLVGPGNVPSVKFKRAQGDITIGLGQSVSNVYVAFIGARIVVVCDDMHWKIFPRP